MNLEAQIEAVLFYKTEPMKKSALAELLSATPEAIDEGIVKLSAALIGRGVALSITDTSVQLVTAPEMSELIESVRKEEIRGDIGKAGAETLAIVLYKGPLSRAEIDRIRGVNSTFILRNLLIRGLVERRPHPTDSRSHVYAITPALLNHLGIQSREGLPEFPEVMNALDLFEKEAVQEETSNPFTQT